MRRQIIIIIVILIVVSGATILLIKTKSSNPVNLNQDNDKEEIENDKSLKYFDTKYSINDMYNFISKHQIPEDEEFYDILLNWYDYYSEDNIFINWFGEEFTINEYRKIRREYSDDTLKVLLISAPKSWFLPILSE